MTALGFIKLYRGVFDEDAYKVRFSPAAAWIDLLLMTEFEDGGSFFHRGMQIKLKRGQAAVSREELAKRWCWTVKQVRNRIEIWESRGQLVRPIDKLPILEIVNYDKYQLSEKGPSNGPSKQPNEGRQNDAETNYQSDVYDFAEEEKGHQNQEKRAVKWAIKSKEKERSKEIENIFKEERINSHTTAQAHVCVQMSERERGLYDTLARQGPWLEAMAMKYCSEMGDTREEQMQALYGAIRAFQERCYLEGHKGHSSLGDLQQHINRALPRLLKDNQQHTHDNEQSTQQPRASDRRRATPPSKHFTATL